MADIAKAYVQIIPTTKDIASNIKNAINGEDMSKVGESMGSNLASGIKSAILKAGIGAAIGKTLVDSIKNGAEFEQLYGGAEKIFSGMDVSQILDDSVNAYKTMGMSANEYLSVINDVGAGFKANMGSQAGYEYAQRGLQAISDYATGTGKDMNMLSQKFTMITRSTSSYQSIADQFSGLLPATSKAFLEQAQAAGDLSSEYTSLSQVPIDEYQKAVTSALERGTDALNLTGNTAREAETTLSGSVNSMVKAWDNFKTSLTVPEIDASEAVYNLVDSFKDVVNNIIPIFEEMGPEIANALAQGLTELGPLILDVLGKTIMDVLKSIPEMFSKLDFGGVVVAIGMIGSAFIKIVPAIKGAYDAIVAFNAACAANPYALIAIAISAAAVAAGYFAVKLHDAYLESEAGQNFIDEWARISQGFEDLGIQAGTLNDVISYCFASINRTLDAVGGVLQMLGGEFDALGQRIGGSLGEALSNAGQKMSELGDAMETGLTAVVEKLGSWGAELAQKGAESVEKLISSVKNALANAANRLKDAGRNMAEGILKGFQERIDAVKRSISNAVEGITTTIKELLGIHSPSRVWADLIGANMAEGIALGFTSQMPKVNSELSNELKNTLGTTNTAMNTALRSNSNMSMSSASDTAKQIADAMRNVTVQSSVVLEGDAGKLFKSVNNQNRSYKNITGRSAFA